MASTPPVRAAQEGPAARPARMDERSKTGNMSPAGNRGAFSYQHTPPFGAAFLLMEMYDDQNNGFYRAGIVGASGGEERRNRGAGRADDGSV